jgi:nitrite reductase/ring-hydroxylating ferredoxin subunit
MGSGHSQKTPGGPSAFDSGLRPEAYERPAPIETPWGSFALFRLDEGFVAVQSFCPHLEGPLFQGTRSSDEIVCPWHRWRFALRTGELLEAEADSPEEKSRALGDHDLAVCEVSVGPAGTLVLARPRRPVRDAQLP